MPKLWRLGAPLVAACLPPLDVHHPLLFVFFRAELRLPAISNRMVRLLGRAVVGALLALDIHHATPRVFSSELHSFGPGKTTR